MFQNVTKLYLIDLQFWVVKAEYVCFQFSDFGTNSWFLINSLNWLAAVQVIRNSIYAMFGVINKWSNGIEMSWNFDTLNFNMSFNYQKFHGNWTCGLFFMIFQTLMPQL